MTAIAGVRFGRCQRAEDDRGSFTEIWRASSVAVGAGATTSAAPGVAGFVQVNASSSREGVLRGLHVHRKQLDHWTVLSGRAFVGLVDLRGLVDGSRSSPIVDARELVAGDWIEVPPLVAHGFLALEPLLLLYLVTNEYDGTDELGFAWDDPLAGVPWPAVRVSPDGRPILSERDRSNPSLDELVVRLRAAAS
jgi:dTDP-4-dehydrorhamnose 3,5-epimerase-like enzyme